MNNINALLTGKISKLISEAEKLKPNSPINFVIMSDEALLKASAGAATKTDNSGKEIIYVDPTRATEYLLAHEVMHIILHRSGWPQMYCIIPEEIDPFANRLADTLDNIIDHSIFNHRLRMDGFDVNGYYDWFFSKILEWPSNKITGPSVLWNGLYILEILLDEREIKEEVLTHASTSQPESTLLARQLKNKARKVRKGNKEGARLALIELLDFLESWIAKQSNNIPNLRKKIGISPLFTKGQLDAPARDFLTFSSHQLLINSTQVWVGGLVMRKDGIRIRNYTSIEAKSEPNEFESIRQHLQILTLKEFFKAEDINKYGTLP